MKHVIGVAIIVFVLGIALGRRQQSAIDWTMITKAQLMQCTKADQLP